MVSVFMSCRRRRPSGVVPTVEPPGGAVSAEEESEELPPIETLFKSAAAGGRWADGVYVDTHADPLPPEPLALLEGLMTRGYRGGVLLERDENFVSRQSLEEELDRIQGVLHSHQNEGCHRVG